MRKLLLSTLIAAGTLAAPVPLLADVGGKMMAPIQEGRFAVMAGASLRTTLEGWARNSQWTVIWDMDSDYRIRASAVFPGGFEGAVVDLVDSIHLDNPELSVVLYRGNSVVHVESRYAVGD